MKANTDTIATPELQVAVVLEQIDTFHAALQILLKEAQGSRPGARHQLQYARRQLKLAYLLAKDAMTEESEPEVFGHG